MPNGTHQPIDDNRLIHLSVEDQRSFVELLLNPPAPTPAMERAKRAHVKLIRESR